MDGLSRGRVLTMIRYRECDHAVHSFTFSISDHVQSTRYRLIERFENGIVQEEFIDVEAVAVLCNWLLYLQFDANMYAAQNNNEDN